MVDTWVNTVTRSILLPTAVLLGAAACSPDAAPPEASHPPAAPATSPPTSEAHSAPMKPGLYLGSTARHACLLDDAGTLRCWGKDDHGQLGDGGSVSPQQRPTPVRDLPPVARAALGARHTCALLQDGSVQCWGDGTGRRRAVVSGLGEVTEMAAGAGFTCAVNAAREVYCWGLFPGASEAAAEPQRIADLEATHIAASSTGVCALRTSGSVACWGENKDGSIVPKGHAVLSGPTDVEGLDSPVDIAMSDDDTCALLSSGKLSCWGRRHFWSWGPHAVYGIEDAVTVTGGATGHFCALTRGGAIGCVGESKKGAKGDTSWTTEIAGDYREVRAGADFTCALSKKDQVTCWGMNDAGQLAQAHQDAMPAPRRLGSMEGARVIAAAGDLTCAALADRSVLCWGPDPTGNNTEDAGPHTYQSVMRADDILMGGGSAGKAGADERAGVIVCALTDKLPTCWGSNRASHLPTINPGVVSEPATLASLNGYKSIALGLDHACALSEAGDVSCWGGIGKARVTATPVAGVTGAAAIALGEDQGCALLGDGTAACFPLKDPPAGSRGRARFTAAKIAGIRGATSIAHGRAHACVIDLRGGVACFRGAAAPAKVAGIDDAVELALGDDFTCARRRGGAVACWGKNDRGQLGDGTFDDRAAPSDALGLEEVTAVRAGSGHACALTKKGAIFCWGDNRTRVVDQEAPLISRRPLPVLAMDAGSSKRL